ncbi:MAG: META domain-containing protein [Rhodococcus sp.]|nr:META domain-containing protein [Rhodococcus sp. (in: high G+C Gram-positive bacteria)]
MRRTLAVLAAAATSLAVLSACSSESEDAPSADPTGRTFISTDVEGEQIPGGGPLTVGFPESGRISATAGCNQAGGSVDLADGTLTTGPLAMTMMACIGDTANADAWMQQFLESGPQWTLDADTLTLTGENSTVTLIDKKVAQPDKPIVGTTWHVTSLISTEAIETSQALEDAAPHFTIGDDGTVTGSAGCNQMTGRATISNQSGATATITFEPVGTTMMACDDDAMAVEAAVLSALSGETTATVDGDTLRLQRADGVGVDARATS